MTATATALGVAILLIGLVEGAEVTPEQYWMVGMIITWMGILTPTNT